MDVSPANSDLLLRLLSASSLRARVIAGNVANQEAAGYKRREVTFEETLAKQLEQGRSLEDLEQVLPDVGIDADATVRADGNSVDMEAETNASRENRLLYELYSSILRGQNRLTEIALRSGR